MAVKLEFDTREFVKAMALYTRATGKTMEDAINHAAWNALVDRNYGCIRNSFSTKKEKIVERLLTPHPLKETRAGKRVVTIRRRSRPMVIGLASAQAKKKGEYKRQSPRARVRYLGSVRWNKVVAKRAKRIINRRVSNIGYAGAGWSDAAAMLAPIIAAQGRNLGKAPKPRSRRRSAATRLGSAEAASVRKLTAFIRHHGNRIFRTPNPIGTLNRALVGAARDMREYALRKMDKDAKAHSGR
ncbi:MAG TPA: hypothetical protein VFI76_01920 [Terrimicrobiaceae bacterium]|nr:hypothetical protein [Terrimicrobiaceae bacterium]